MNHHADRLPSPYDKRYEPPARKAVLVRLPLDIYERLTLAAPCDSIVETVLHYGLHAIDEHIKHHDLLFNPAAVQDALRRLTIASPDRHASARDG